MDTKPVDFNFLIEQAISHQHQKVLLFAQAIRPFFTEEDILQPFDHPELEKNPSWNYEDGVLAGLKIAQILYHSKTELPTEKDLK